MRLFVAAWPAREVVRALEALPRPAHPAVRWTPPEQWHVTLRFLGELDEGVEADVVAALAAVGPTCRRPTAVVGPVTRRLGRGVLVAPVDGLDDLAGSVVEATSRFGRPPDRRPFTGHLTLARGRGRRPVPAALAGEALAASWEVHGVSLVHSDPGPSGAGYTSMAEVPLGR